MILNNQRYYLMGYSDKWERMTFQRIDRMTNIEITEDVIDEYVQQDYDTYFYQGYETIDAYKETFDSEDYREQIMADKVADFIVENAKIVEP
jgi:trigger factor